MRHTIGALAALAALAVLGAAVVGGCGGATAALPASPSPSAPPSSAPPSTPADITGAITDLTTGGSLPVLLVVADPASDSSVDKASVRVTKATVVWTAQAVRGTAADLARGELVAVWFTGPVAESYPVQATAGVVRILLSD